MKITEENAEQLIKLTGKKESEVNLVLALLKDIEDINSSEYTKNPIHLSIETEHTEYSCERTEPCPDFYGLYSIRDENCNTIGEPGDIDVIDLLICTIYEFIETQQLKK